MLQQCPLQIDEIEDLTYTTVAHTLCEADITCGANITDITHAKQDVQVYHIHTTCIGYSVSMVKTLHHLSSSMACNLKTLGIDLKAGKAAICSCD